jgi:hypothetical protein
MSPDAETASTRALDARRGSAPTNTSCQRAPSRTTTTTAASGTSPGLGVRPGAAALCVRSVDRDGRTLPVAVGGTHATAASKSAVQMARSRRLLVCPFDPKRCETSLACVTRVGHPIEDYVNSCAVRATGWWVPLRLCGSASLALPRGRRGAQAARDRHVSIKRIFCEAGASGVARGGVAWDGEGMVSTRTRRRRSGKSVVAARSSGVFDPAARVARRGCTRAEAPVVTDARDDGYARARLRG